MPYVPAHTRAVGASQRNVSTKLTYSIALSTGSPVYSDLSSTTVLDVYSNKSPTVDGDFSLIFPGFRKPTTYVRSVARCTDVSGGCSLSYRNGSRRFTCLTAEARHSAFFNVSTTFVGGEPSISSSLVNRALAECLTEVANMRVNVGTMLGEARRTIDMITDTILALVRAYRSFRNGNVALGLSFLGISPRRNGHRGSSPENAWLQYQYGWLPLLSDIYGGVELLQMGFRSQQALFSVERTITQALDPARFVRPASGNQLVTSGEASESCKVKLFGCVTADTHILASLGLINPLSLAWELLPFSFVIDWLVPIGTWLESLTATVGVTFAGGFRTDMVSAGVEGELTYLSTVGGSNPLNYHSFEGRFPAIRMDVMAMKRTTYSTWPWALPYWRNPFNTTRIVSAVALLAQQRRR